MSDDPPPMLVSGESTVGELSSGRRLFAGSSPGKGSAVSRETSKRGVSRESS